MSETIMTPEELDALPEGTVIRDGDGDILVKRSRERWCYAREEEPCNVWLPATVIHRCPVTETAPAPAVDPRASGDAGAADPAGAGATPLAALAGLAVALEAADRVRRRASDANAPLEVLAGVDGVIEEIVEAVRTLRESL